MLKKISLFKGIAIAFSLPLCLFGQNVKKVQTYYDYAHQYIKEEYTVIASPPYLKHGLYRMWDDRKTLVNETNYSNDKRNGLTKNYYTYLITEDRIKIGKVWQQMNYKNDVLSGNWVQYDYLKNGTQIKIEERVYTNGTISKQLTYFDNGVLSEVKVLNGQCLSYYDNSKLFEKYNVIDGVMNGSYFAYFQNGKVKVKAKYKDDIAIDTLTEYFENGKLKGFQYRNPQNKIISIYKENYPNGKPKFERKQVGENLFSVVEYDSIGGYLSSKYSEMINFEDKNQGYIKTGEYQSFHPNGKPNLTTSYKDGYSEGICISKDELGNEIINGQFKDGYRYGKWKIFYNADWEMADDLKSSKYYRLISYGDKEEIIGKVQDFYISGEKQFEGVLKSIDPDVLGGEAIFYHKNGKIKAEGVFQKDDTVQVKSYTENGLLLEEIEKNKTSRKVKYYRKDGTPIEKGQYFMTEAGVWLKDGIWEYFDEKGNRKRVEKYEDGGLVSTE
ncbi:MAG: hypothetical protein SFY32_06820 [Bacteroidota bacterium]|nr:hypothetical protein [Bacteroidota bacterium]